MNTSHQPGSEPLQIPEQIPNPAVRPAAPEPNPGQKEPVELPEKVPRAAHLWKDRMRLTRGVAAGSLTVWRRNARAQIAPTQLRHVAPYVAHRSCAQTETKLPNQISDGEALTQVSGYGCSPQLAT